MNWCISWIYWRKRRKGFKQIYRWWMNRMYNEPNMVLRQLFHYHPSIQRRWLIINGTFIPRYRTIKNTNNKYITVVNTTNSFGAIRYFEWPIFRLKTRKNHAIHNSNTLDNSLAEWFCCETTININIQDYGSIQSTNKWQHFFLFTWSVRCLYLEAFTVEFIKSKNWSRLSTKLSS